MRAQILDPATRKPTGTITLPEGAKLYVTWGDRFPCARCGKMIHINGKEGFHMSRQIRTHHEQYYWICEECHKKEMEEENDGK